MNQDYTNFSFSKIPQQQNFTNSLGLTELASPEGRDLPSEARIGSVSDRSFPISAKPVTGYWFKKDREAWIEGGTSSTLKARPKGVLSDEYLKPKKKRGSSLEKLKPYKAWYSCNDLHNPELRTVCSCNDWINCQYCRIKRQTKNQRDIENYFEAVELERKKKKNLQFQTYKLITITQKFILGADIGYMLDLIQKNFKKLRNRKCWEKHVPTNYFKASYEFSEDKTNIHVHIMALCKFWDVHDLSKEWLDITKDSFIVDIRPITSIEEGIKEVAKYIVKDTNPELVKELSDFRIANPKRRYIVTGRRPPLLDTIAISEHPVCKCCGEKKGLHGQFKDEIEAETWLITKLASLPGHIRSS